MAYTGRDKGSFEGFFMVTEKRCPKCGVLKPSHEFSKDNSRKDGLQYKCNQCIKEYYQENKEKLDQYRRTYAKNNPDQEARYKRKWAENNVDKIKTYHKEYKLINKDRISDDKKKYRQANKETIREKDRIYRAQHQEEIKAYRVENSTKIALQTKAYREAHQDEMKLMYKKWKKENKDKVREYARLYIGRRRKEDPEFIIKDMLRKRLNNLISAGHAKKTESALLLVGCSISELKQYIESNFLPGMSWDNHSPKGWHIDHIKPCAAFDLTDPEQQRQCFHYTNLQPLWAKDNIRKGAKWEE